MVLNKERRKLSMVSPNHINYWNYLETVTANRNKEAIQREGQDSQIALNETQKRLNIASTNKLGADIQTALAQAKSILANIDFTKRLTVVKERELKLNLDRWAQEFGINADKLAVYQGELNLAIDKMNQDKEMKAKDRELAYVKIVADFFGGIFGNSVKAGVATMSGKGSK